MPILSRGVLLALLSFSFLFCPKNTIASLGVVINEIAWMGTTEGWQYEWIELYNNQAQEASIKGCQIDNAKAKGGVLELLEEKVIPAGGYFLICKKETMGCDLSVGSLSLNNDYQENGGLVLKDASGNIVDQTPVPHGSGWPAGDNETKQTMERKSFSLAGENILNWGSSQNPGGTPKNKNSVLTESINFSRDELPTKRDTPSSVADVLINEIMPSPSGPDSQEEWIEIFNQNNFEVNLSGWKISDLAGATTSYVFTEGLKIRGKGFLVLERPKTKIVLNNEGDGLVLFQPSGNLVHQVLFEKAPQGQSYNRTLSDLKEVWVWSEKPSPGNVNALTEAKAQGQDNKEKLGENQNATSSQKSFFAKEQLAAVSQQLPREEIKFLKPALIALFLAIFSGALILTIKRGLKTDENMARG